MMIKDFPSVPVLYSAGSWFVGGKLRVPLHLNRVNDIICDCGSFTLHQRFGGFPFSWGQYMDWVGKINPKWFALWDKPGDPMATQKLIEKHGKSNGIPTCQGDKPSDYRAHAKDLRGYKLIAVGNMVRDDINYKAIIDAILTELPDVKLHLWGFGLNRLKKIIPLNNQVESVDSSSWNGRWGKGILEYKEGRKQGYTQREYAIKFMLPRYQDKINKWNNKPRQLNLF